MLRKQTIAGFGLEVMLALVMDSLIIHEEILLIVSRGNFTMEKYQKGSWFAINAISVIALDRRIFLLEPIKITFLICTKREEALMG